MTAISAYTEPVPVAAVSEPQQQAHVHEPEENEEQSSFAELLAGLLNNTEKIQADIPPADLSNIEINLDGLADEEAKNDKSIDLFGNVNETVIIPEKNFSDIEIPVEQLVVMQSAEHLIHIDSLLDDGLSGMEIHDDFLPEISNLLNSEHLPEAEPGQVFFAVDSEQTVSVSQAAAAGGAADIEKDIAPDTGGKKERLPNERAVSNNESAETLAANTSRSEETKSLRKEPENDKPGRLDEMRSRRRGFTLEVRDHRTGGAKGLNNTQNHSFSAVEAAMGRSHGETPVREITLELRLPDNQGQSAAQTSPQMTWEAKAGTALENMLARELHQNFNGDIVRHASMALRDGGEGVIKIALKPESLGNVKIRLEMTENKITGQIIVESEEALNAFRKEIASLEQAFRDSGFTNADLNLSMTADQRNAQGWEQEPDSFTPRMIASRYDDSFESETVNMVDVFIGHKLGSINMLA